MYGPTNCPKTWRLKLEDAKQYKLSFVDMNVETFEADNLLPNLAQLPAIKPGSGARTQ